ncbi:hypothetical protein [Streptacidiphilus sp. P02-A3a]|uniref:hypothetical protein n=1 Tax=Streptacidiphilus sp. P02-A3a TaxID=2704468 RepID=UPI0015F8BE41|nr:hypothetical protein [Streptacidiphilus sp. P02-A3a]QMU73391.1 hypothetical protein GXP74_39385 [Streptacidiphilus sp. P02-A3a]
MTDTGTDISELLADAALGVRIKHAPVEAIVVGGRRRRSRRRAAGAVVIALAVVCTAGILTSVSPGEDSGATSVAAEPDAVPRPSTEVIATGLLDGKHWTLSVDVWKRAADTKEAGRVWKAMEEAEYPDPQRAGGPGGPQLVHTGWFFASLKVGERHSFVYDGALTGAGNRKVETSWGKFTPTGSSWFVFGFTAPGVHAVTCTWDDGRKAAPPLRTVAGTDSRFFAIDAPAPKPNAGQPRCTAVD